MAPPDTPRIEPLFGADEIAARVDGLAGEIARAMPGDVLLVEFCDAIDAALAPPHPRA